MGIGNANPNKPSYLDATSYVWDSYGAWTGGTQNRGLGGWKRFEEGDEVFLMYEPKMKKLTMKVKRLGKDTSFELECDNINEPYIHIFLWWWGDQVTLDEMTAEEQIDYFGHSSNNLFT